MSVEGRFREGSFREGSFREGSFREGRFREGRCPQRPNYETATGNCLSNIYCRFVAGCGPCGRPQPLYVIIVVSRTFAGGGPCGRPQPLYVIIVVSRTFVRRNDV